jgi:hypothetical protein
MDPGLRSSASIWAIGRWDLPLTLHPLASESPLVLCPSALNEMNRRCRLIATCLNGAARYIGTWSADGNWIYDWNWISIFWRVGYAMADVHDHGIYLGPSNFQIEYDKLFDEPDSFFFR